MYTGVFSVGRQQDDADFEPSRLRGYASDGALNRLQVPHRPKPLYNMVRYNTVLDITWFKVVVKNVQII